MPVTLSTVTLPECAVAVLRSHIAPERYEQFAPKIISHISKIFPDAFAGARLPFAVFETPLSVNGDLDVAMCAPVARRSALPAELEYQLFESTPAVVAKMPRGTSPRLDRDARALETLYEYAFAQNYIIAGDAREVFSPNGKESVEFQIPVQVGRVPFRDFS